MIRVRTLDKVVYEKLFEDAQLPVPATELAAGADVYAYLLNRETEVFQPYGGTRIAVGGFVLGSGERAAVPLGFKAQVPAGWEAQVRTRSGLALKQGIVVANSPGTIDADYPGEWKVILLNTSTTPVYINHNDRIAQVVLAQLAPVIQWEAGTVGQVSNRTGGFGSTGV